MIHPAAHRGTPDVRQLIRNTHHEATISFDSDTALDLPVALATDGAASTRKRSHPIEVLLRGRFVLVCPEIFEVVVLRHLSIYCVQEPIQEFLRVLLRSAKVGHVAILGHKICEPGSECWQPNSGGLTGLVVTKVFP